MKIIILLILEITVLCDEPTGKDLDRYVSESQACYTST